MDKKLIVKKIVASPEDIQTLIYSTDLSDTANNLAKQYNLNPEQEIKIARETLLVLVGETKITSFQNRLVSQVGLGEDITKKIIVEIDSKIFEKVRDSLNAIQFIETKTEVSKIAGIETETGSGAEVKNEPIQPSQTDVLAEIENPTPTKIIISNPAGKNTILDAQHNLPESEKKTLISSSSVPSRGPLLGKNNVIAQQIKAPTPTTNPEGHTVDPYREPIE